jgi:hypothetical protein
MFNFTPLQLGHFSAIFSLSSLCYCTYSSSLLFLYSEDGSKNFNRTVDRYLPEYVESHLKDINIQYNL